MARLFRHVASLAGATLVLASHAAPLPAQPSPLTLDAITAPAPLFGSAPASPQWSPDSRQVAFLWNDRGLPARTLWLVARGDSLVRRLIPRSDSGVVSEFAWAPDGKTVVYLMRGDVHRVDPATNAVERVTTDGGDKSDLTISPDGQHVAFLRDGDLWLLSSGERTARRLTSVGVPPIGAIPLGTYHRPDVEIGSATWGGDAPAYAWSPDSRTIAVHYVDRRGVPVFRMPYYLGDSTRPNLVRRSAPGMANEVRKVGLLQIAAPALQFIELPDSSRTRIVNFAWSRTGTLLIDRETDDAIDRDVYVVAPGSRTPRRIWRDHRDTRIYNEIASAWSADGKSVLLTGDLEDRYRVYRLTPGDTTPVPLTPATSDVSGAATGLSRSIIFAGNHAGPSERHLFQVQLNGSRLRQLTTIAGTHRGVVSPDGGAVALLTSNDVTPSELYLLETAPGAREVRVTRSQPPDFARVPWVRAQYITVPSRTATPRLHLRVLYPPGLDSSRRYPVLFGPVYSNTVRNRWEGRYAALQQYLAIEKGYIVVQVDVRGSTGYGRDFREKFLMDWGGDDLEDLASAVDHMKSLPFVDGTRLGIWGSSYGGTLTVYSLLKRPGLFQAGVAGAPAVDPYQFGSDDVAIARRPQTHPQTFTRGALQYAGNLRDHLLIIHGMQDDVVPFETSVKLAEEFMRLGKPFDFAFAPGATHGWTQRPYYARYLLTRLVEHFDRHLGAGPR